MSSLTPPEGQRSICGLRKTGSAVSSLDPICMYIYVCASLLQKLCSYCKDVLVSSCPFRESLENGADGYEKNVLISVRFFVVGVLRF